MYIPIAASTLRTGETLETGVVLAPDDEYEPLVRPVLAHKSRNDQWHLDEVFAGRVAPLETRFYLGRLDAQPVCNIMVSEHEGIGIVSHVYTVPEHRRKGIARLVMAGQMADFRDRSGRYLTLSTGYDTHPYYLYHSFGFRSVIPESGHMKYMGTAAFEPDHFRGEGALAVPGDWRNWPSLNVLCAQDGPPYVRNVGLGHIGPRMFEGAYIGLMKLARVDADHQVQLLVSDREVVAGYATLVPDTRWRGEACLLDLFVHPAFTDYCGPLLDSFSLPPARKVQCHVEVGDTMKAAALLDAGFVREATLRKQFKVKGQVVDVEVYARYA